jgi:hypothetical protein
MALIAAVEAYLPPCYKSRMTKTVEQWLLDEYIGLEFTPLSKPLKNGEQADGAGEVPRARTQNDGAGRPSASEQ